MKWPIAVAALFIVAPAVTVLAQEEPIMRLLSAKSLKCQFRPGTIAEWKETEFAIQRDTWKGETHYDSIDLEGGSARLIGNQGATDVMVLPTAAGLTFVEGTAMGSFNFTTVYAANCGSAGSFCAVMSRHMNLLGDPLSSQYHGTCRVWE